MTQRLCHPQLGNIKGCQVTHHLIQFRSLPYAQVPRRFARSILLECLSQHPGNPEACYDAAEYGPCSIQSLESIATDVRWNQLPEYPRRDQTQSEDCLRISLTCPTATLKDALAPLPVVVFIHGGAFMIGSGTSRVMSLTSRSTMAKLTEL